MLHIICCAILIIVGALWLSEKKDEAKAEKDTRSVEECLASLDKRIKEMNYIPNNACAFLGLCSKIEKTIRQSK